MRVIKFRAWHTVFEKYLEPEQWYHYGPNIIEGELSSEPAFGSPCMLEQFTGLCDAKGVEIYEGDILYSKRFWWTPGVVVFHQEDNIMRWLLRKKNGSMSYNRWDYGNLQIIGNVHENPELLQ